MTDEPQWHRPYVVVQCEGCGTRYPAAESKSPSAERETRCQRCLRADVARLERLLAAARTP